jgi:rod shape-determining protein MreB
MVGFLASAAVRGGCCALRRGVTEKVERETGLQLTEAEAERPGASCRTSGRRARANQRGHGDCIKPGLHLPRRHPIPANIIAEAIELVTGPALDAASAFVETVEAGRLAEVMETGVLLTGGGALIPGMRGAIQRTSQIPVIVARLL